jgi:hypothetical protein
MSNNIQGKVVVVTIHYGANPLGEARVKVSPLKPGDAVVC